MAGEWLKFECSLPEKPETMAITAAMGWDDTDLTVGKLMRLFRWFDQQTMDGNAVGVTPVLLDKVIGVTGFVQAVIAVRWLTVTDTGLALHNFDRHNGATAKSRAQTATRVANHRAEHKAKQGLGDGNAVTVTSALAREEKRREELNTKPTALSAAKLPSCPHKQILALFSERLPELPQPKPELWDGQRAKDLAARWKWLLTKTKQNGSRYATDEAEALDFFRRFFGYVSESDFLSGRDGRWTGCDLGWLVKSENFAKVLQGNYQNKDAA